jgi:hypothetical protein
VLLVDIWHLEGNLLFYIADARESEILADYFQRKSPVWAGIEGRIIFLNEIGDSGTVTIARPLSLPFLALLSVVVFLGQ